MNRLNYGHAFRLGDPYNIWRNEWKGIVQVDHVGSCLLYKAPERVSILGRVNGANGQHRALERGEGLDLVTGPEVGINLYAGGAEGFDLGSHHLILSRCQRGSVVIVSDENPHLASRLR